MSENRTSIDFTIGSRRLLTVPRHLATLKFTLEDILEGTVPTLDDEASDADGLRVLSAPREQVGALLGRFPGHVAGGRHDYPRHYIDMAGSYEEYLARFSGKTRSTLKRKQRKLAKDCGGEYEVTEHRTPAELEAFLAAAIPLSAKTYQARLLDAGLPERPEARRAMLEQAERGDMRSYLLCAAGKPIAYLTLPVDGRTLIYAYLGYDPDWARLSPGTVLQMEALERLFAENRFRYFDFTEGDGGHKAMFGTDSVECASFLLLRKTIANRALLGARVAFDGAVGTARAVAQRTGALAKVRSALKT